MKKTFLLFLILFLALSVSSASTAFAQTCPNGQPQKVGNDGKPLGCDLGYSPLEPIQGVTSGQNGQAISFPTLLGNIYKIAITIGALFSVLMLTVSGIRYMLSDVVTDKARAIKRIQACLYGLVLIAVSWLILNTINPQLVTFNLNPGSGTVTAPTGSNNTGGAGDNPINGAPCGNDPNNAGGCSADKYCGTVSLIDGNTLVTCLSNTNKAADKNCTDSGGNWYQDSSGAYCWLSSFKTKEECESPSVGGKWQSRWFTTSYCYK